MFELKDSKEKCWHGGGMRVQIMRGYVGKLEILSYISGSHAGVLRRILI